tara:strand:+ start:141 stop:563 length:423 start_codon:yes stop_codon:yes gene_type:complete
MPTLYQEMGYGLDMKQRVEAVAPDLIVNLSDDRWFGATSASELQVMNQVVRAVELRVPVLRVAYGGVSVLVDASGEIIRRTGLLVQAAESWPLPPRRISHLYPAATRVTLHLLFALTLLVTMGHHARARLRRRKTKTPAR